MRIKDFVDSFKVKHETVMSKGVKLQVVENDKIRMFKLDDATNSTLNKQSIYTGGYWDYFIPLAYAYRNPRILMIGLGIGTVPYQLHALLGKRIKLDIVEYDPKVVELAKKYALKRLRDRIFVQDGYDYVVKTKRKYDIIILDAYGKGARIPKQFYEEDFAKNASRILNPKGTLAINYAMHPYGILKFGNYRKILEKFFRVYGINTKNPGDMQIILCSKKLTKNKFLEKIRSTMKRSRENDILIESYENMHAS